MQLAAADDFRLSISAAWTAILRALTSRMEFLQTSRRERRYPLSPRCPGIGSEIFFIPINRDDAHSHLFPRVRDLDGGRLLFRDFQ